MLHKHKIISFLAFLLTCQFAIGQRSDIATQGAESLALGHISSVHHGHNTMANNFSATLFNTQSFGININSERRFNLSELTASMISAFKTIDDKNAVGLLISDYGFEEWREQKISLGYTRKLSDKFAIAAVFDLNTIRIKENGSKNFPSFGLQMTGFINKNLRYGVKLFNFENADINEFSPPSQYIQVGLAHQVSKKTELLVEFDKHIDEILNIRAGTKYNPLTPLNLYLGYETGPGRMSFGFGYCLQNKFQLDFAASYDNLLGVTPGLSLAYFVSK